MTDRVNFEAHKAMVSQLKRCHADIDAQNTAYLGSIAVSLANIADSLAHLEALLDKEDKTCEETDISNSCTS